jgi:hypothetical protein
MPSGIPELGVAGGVWKFSSVLRQKRKFVGAEIRQTDTNWLSQCKFAIMSEKGCQLATQAGAEV